ncbi:hypothetical protein Agabi119p4_7903 [Agaricus bisporus var. burnettii]|uniref:DUF6535 domain-containing protein n=1 Tax=Agaricus bisporus var. burnettii TaxID=192524 RepID=A0A8H7C947_AGABI|nr:hypothetical protein Agabi119p4_7903 [Agaricus bisporus var. burnettii]
MPPKPPEKKHLDTTNSDDIKEAFHRFLCFISQSDSGMIKELNEQLDKITSGSLRPQAPQKIHFDRMNSDDIKDSLLSFSQTIEDLKMQARHVGQVSGWIPAAGTCQRTFICNREDLDEQIHREKLPAARQKFYTRKKNFADAPSDTLPIVLETLAASINLLYTRTNEFQEFTTEGARLKDVFSTLKTNLSYRASFTRDYSNRLNTTVIQRYIHQFIYDLQTDFDKVAGALSEFTAIGIPAIRDEKARAFKSLTNILAAATLFSGVTASSLQMSTALSNPNNTILVVNALWFTSLTLSVGAALNCVLYGAFVRLSDMIEPLISSNTDTCRRPPWITWWMKGSHSFLLGASILTFSAGLSVFTFSSDQAIYTPYLTITSMILASAGLGAILIWILYIILMVPKEQLEADAIRPSSDSIHSGPNKVFFFYNGIPIRIKNALLPSPREQNVDEEEEITAPQMSPNHREHELADQPKAKNTAQGKVKNVNIDPKKEPNPDETDTSATLIKLIIPGDPASEKNEFGSYGTIRYIAYSDDGKWLAITCAKEELYYDVSWTTVIDAKTLQSKKEIHHGGMAVSEFLKWSPSGKKLIVKFESNSRFDIWDLDAEAPRAFRTDEGDIVEDVAWFDENAILVAERSKFTKMDSDLVAHQVSILLLAVARQ